MTGARDRRGRPKGSGHQAGSHRVSSYPRFVRALLRIPLFYKLLVANVGVIAVAAAVWLSFARPPGDSLFADGTAWVLVGGAVLVGAVVANGIVLRVALSPLDALERTARAVSAGDTTPRVATSPVADRRLERLTFIFNDMLDRTEEYQRRLRELAARSLAAQEEERKRVSRELHDDTGQRLAAALLRLGLLRSQIRNPEVDAGLEELRSDLVETVEALRAFARDLRPPALSELGLVPAIDAHLRSVRERSSFQVELVHPSREPALDPEVELVVYRIVQEAVSNAVRHASPKRVRVTVAVTDEEVSLAVEDDGCGFRSDQVLRRRDEGLGLFGMEERAGYVGGRVHVISAPGKGTRISVRIPRTPVSPGAAGPPSTGPDSPDALTFRAEDPS